MKIPKSITVDLKGVHIDEQEQLIDRINVDEFKSEYVKNRYLKFHKFELLEDALEVMHFLEVESYKWKVELNEPKEKEAMWIGLNFDGHFGAKEKLCIGLNLENGTDVTMISSLQVTPKWYIPYYDISVKYGENKRVFDDNNELNL